MKYIFLVEEKSMKRFLDIFLKRFSLCANFKVIPHNGKSDLKKSVPVKLKALGTPDTAFVILVDQDSSDCRKLKTEINNICENISGANYKIRIVCHELESWYLGDLSAVDAAFSTNLSRYKNKRKFREPDKLNNAKQELKKHIGNFGQVSTAEKIAEAMTMDGIQNNRSHSFRVFLQTFTSLSR